MHFDVDMESVSRAANFAHAVAKAASSLQDTGNPDHRSIYLSCTPQGLTVRCTTREYQATTLVRNANVFSFGDCMVFSERLADYLETLPIDSKLTFTYDEGLLYVECDKRQGVRTIPAIVPDYAMPEWRLADGHFSQVVAPDFPQDVLFASKYACEDASRSYYGINLDPTGILAFDGFELVKIDRSLPGLPSTTLDTDMVKFISSPKFFGDGDILFEADGKQFRFQFGDSALMGPTMGGDFESSRVAVETLIKPYVSAPVERKLVFDYKEFGAVLATMNASSLDPLDRVLIWPNGNITIGIDRTDNYTERIDVVECTMPKPFAVNLKSLTKMFKEGKDEKLTFNFQPTDPNPQLKQIMVFAGNRIVGFSPSAVAESVTGKYEPTVSVAQELEDEVEETEYDFSTNDVADDVDW